MSGLRHIGIPDAPFPVTGSLGVYAFYHPLLPGNDLCMVNIPLPHDSTAAAIVSTGSATSRAATKTFNKSS